MGVEPGKKDTRLYEIDLLRFIAALSVVFFHWICRAIDAPEFQRLDQAFPITKYGFLGVPLFFMISGFVISMSAEGVSARQFAAARAIRLVPAFWVCCTLTALCMWGFGHPRYPVEFWRYLVNMTMLNGFAAVQPLDGAYWTLFVELKFYIAIALFVRFGQFHKLETILWGWLALTLLLERWGGGPLDLINVQHSTYFIAGAACYLVHRDGMTRARAALIALCWLLSLRTYIVAIPHWSLVSETHYSAWAIGSVLTAMFALIVLTALGQLKPLRTRRWLMLGAVTYPLYLIHQNIGYLIMSRWQGHISPEIAFVVLLAGAILLAYLIHLYVERPLARRMRKWILPRREPHGTEVPRAASS